MEDETKTTTTTTDNNGTQQTPPPAPKPEAKFTQEDMNAVQGNTRKEAVAAERKRLYKELGIEDTDDPKALETVKGKLTAAEKAEEERLSDLDKATKRAEQAEAKAEAAEAKHAATEARRIADKVDGRIEALASKLPFNAVDPADVVAWLRNNHKEDMAGLVGDDEKIDEAKAVKLIEKVKAAKEHWFKKPSGVGSPSLSGGRSPQPNEDMNKTALAQLRRNIRNS